MLVSGVISDVLVTTPPAAVNKSLEFRHFHSSLSQPSCGLFKVGCLSLGIPRLGAGLNKSRMRGFTVRALGESGDDVVPIAPVQLESPVGQLLAHMLQAQPHLVPATIDQQLENLQTEREAQKQDSSSLQDILYKRIAEVKEKERHRTLEEILYCFIVHKFLENGIVMIPKIEKTSDPVGGVDFWPNQEMKLESIHSPEAFEMVQSHLSLLLGERAMGPLDTVIQISKTKLGKLYAASRMYGYFLKRVDERFQLERSMKTLPKNFDENRVGSKDSASMSQMWDPDSLIELQPDEFGGASFKDVTEDKAYRLRSYVMYLDPETLQRYATIRSKEAVSLIEKQTQALFGRPDIRILEDGSLNALNDEVISLTFSGLTMLVLEAIAFGSFLWDAEGYVESRFHFLETLE